MTTIPLDKAKVDLAALLDRALAGEEIIIAKDDAPGVRLQPVPPFELPQSYRGRGLLKGKISVSDEDLFGTLPDDELRLWNEGD
jgi:antitoxin (DNA-binding transcriptional repressor) of toxin-antitoxin stability system